MGRSSCPKQAFLTPSRPKHNGTMAPLKVPERAPHASGYAMNAFKPLWTLHG